MTPEETVHAFVATSRGWSYEHLKLLLVALETEIRARSEAGCQANTDNETPMERWWREGGVLFKDE